MTVSTELSHEEYTGNGVTTDFDFRFRIFEAKHLVVSVADQDGTERILTNGTDYTLRGVGSYRGGKVILKMPLATGWKIGIARDLPAVQETDLRNQGKFFAEVHEDAFDYLTMLIQKSLGYLSLCLRKPSFISDHYDAKGNKISNLGKPVKDGDAVDLGTMTEHISAKDKRSLRVADKDIPALPNAANRANKLLSFDNNGDPIVIVPEPGSAADVLVELGKPGGAGLIGAESGNTVQDELKDTDRKITELIYDLRSDSVNSNNHKMLDHLPESSFRYVGFLITGQSLAEGGVGYDICPAIQSTLNTNAYTLSGGPVGVTDKILGSRLNNINEPVRATIASTMCDRILTNGIAGKTIFSGQAWGGKAYKDVRKGGSTGVYEKCVSQVSDVVKNIKTVEYRAVVFIHGEQDGVDNNQSYATNLGEWIADFNVDIRNATGQSASIPAYFCQTASSGGYGHNGGISDMSFPTPLQQLKAHINNPLLTLVTSKYHLKYYDHAHLTNESQGVLGEYYAKAVSHYEITGTKFEPCRPVSFAKNGNQIIIKFTGTEDGIAIDTDRVNAATNYGFDYTDNSGNTIVSVAVDGVDTVILTLSGTVASGAVVAYAYHNGLGGSDSQKSGYGDRGNIRGTSKFISKVTGEKLHPWCVIFREDI